MSDKNFMSYGDAETVLTKFASDIKEKADKVDSAVNGNFAGFDANGNITDSGVASKTLVTKSLTPGLIQNDGTIDTSKHVHLQPTGSRLTGEVVAKEWNGYTSINGEYIWTDGDNIYYSDNSTQKVLDKSTSTWSNKTWNGYSSIRGARVWTDGDNIYYSYSSTQKVLDKSTSTWSNKSWSGLTNFDGAYIWTDGDNIYYSNYNNGAQYVLDKSTSTWSKKTWTGYSSIDGRFIWTDGTNIYYSNSTDQYVLDKSTSTWSTKTWNIDNLNGSRIWIHNNTVYYINVSDQYVLNGSTWESYIWEGYDSADAWYMWTDGTDTYYSNSSNQYVFIAEAIYADGFVKTDGTIDTNSYARTSDLPGAATSSALGLVKPDGTTITVDSNGTILLVYLEQTVTLSTSAETTVTFTDSRFTVDSCVDVATPWGIVPTDVVTAAGTCTITLPKVDSAQTISVRVYLR